MTIEDIIAGLSEEDQAAINAEIDRARTEASKTAAKNAEKKAKDTFSAKLKEEVEKAQREAEELAAATEQEKVQKVLEKIEAERVSLQKEKLGLKAEKTLREAGLGDEHIEGLLPVFTSAAKDESALDEMLTTFTNVQKSVVDTAKESLKQELANGATPPKTGGKMPPKSDDQVVQEIIASSPDDPRYGVASSIEALFAAQEG